MVTLLQDLRDLAALTKQTEGFASYITMVCLHQARKPALLEKIRKAGMTHGDAG